MLALKRQNRFGMKLHAFDGVLFVSQTHHFVFCRARADFERRRNRRRIDQQRMIAHRVEGTWNSCEDRFAVVNYRRGLAVHQPIRAHDLTAECLADALQAETDAENRNLTRHLAQKGQRDARFGWSARSGRNDYSVGMYRTDAGDVDGVVALDRYVGAEFAEVLHDVVSKRIVVVDHQNSFFLFHFDLPPGSDFEIARGLERPHHRASLVDRLLELGAGVRVGDDAASRLDVNAVALNEQCAQGDRG